MTQPRKKTEPSGYNSGLAHLFIRHLEACTEDGACVVDQELQLLFLGSGTFQKNFQGTTELLRTSSSGTSKRALKMGHVS